MLNSISRCLAIILTCTPLVSFAQSEPQPGGSPDPSVTNMLASLWSAKEMDDKCNVLSNQEKQALRESISTMAKMINLDEKTLRQKMAKTDVAGQLKCNDELAKSLLGTAKYAAQTWIAQTASERGSPQRLL